MQSNLISIEKFFVILKNQIALINAAIYVVAAERKLNLGEKKVKSAERTNKAESKYVFAFSANFIHTRCSTNKKFNSIPVSKEQWEDFSAQ
jgi:hypothetical protein